MEVEDEEGEDDDEEGGEGDVVCPAGRRAAGNRRIQNRRLISPRADRPQRSDIRMLANSLMASCCASPAIQPSGEATMDTSHLSNPFGGGGGAGAEGEPEEGWEAPHDGGGRANSFSVLRSASALGFSCS